MKRICLTNKAKSELKAVAIGVLIPLAFISTIFFVITFLLWINHKPITLVLYINAFLWLSLICYFLGKWLYNSFEVCGD